MGEQTCGKVEVITVSGSQLAAVTTSSSFTFHWPWAIAIAMGVAVIAIVIAVLFSRKPQHEDFRVFSLDEDLNTEHASHAFRIWRSLSRAAIALLGISLCVSIVLLARPMQVNTADERSGSRDIVLCLDVSGSTLPYDREVIETYLKLVDNFQGERIGLSIFNSTSRTVFPLTDDYDLVTSQLKQASDLLQGVQSQDDIDNMSDQDYQQISDWLDGTQNRTEATSLIGDGLVSCAAMLPGFTYGSSTSSSGVQRAASIVLATDNVVSGTPTYTLTQALDLVQSADITVDGLYSGPTQSESDETTLEMKQEIESHGGVFLTQSADVSIEQLVEQIERRKDNANESNEQAALIDAPGWWTAVIAVLVAAWLLCAWRLKR